ncbi:MAG: hypothetical protein R2932_35870 [Caldilineaceae bacterium]
MDGVTETETPTRTEPAPAAASPHETTRNGASAPDAEDRSATAGDAHRYDFHVDVERATSAEGTDTSPHGVAEPHSRQERRFSINAEGQPSIHDDDPFVWPRRPSSQAVVTSESRASQSSQEGSPETEATPRSNLSGEQDPVVQESGAWSSPVRSSTVGNGTTEGAVTSPDTSASRITQADAAPRAQHPAAGAINIKGRAGGILIELGKGLWPELMAALTERLNGAANFFRNGNAAIDLAARPVTEVELKQLHNLLTTQSLELVLIHTASAETFQAALDMGLAAQLETPEGAHTASAQPAL